jgi:hypothetical protein
VWGLDKVCHQPAEYKNSMSSTVTVSNLNTVLWYNLHNERKTLTKSGFEGVD